MRTVALAIALCLKTPAVAAEASDDDGESGPAGFGPEGLTLELAQREVALTLGGRLMLDLAAYSGGGFGGDDGGDVRRARILITAEFFDLLEAFFEYDFADPDEPVSDALVRYIGFERIAIAAGSMEEPFSLEERISSNDLTFMERSLANALAPGRSVGVAADAHGESWHAMLGLFGGNINEDATGEGAALGARAAVAPRLSETARLHLGLAGNHRFDPAAGVEVETRPESFVTDRNLVATGAITAVDAISRLGLEAALVRGPFSLQGEYIGAVLHRGGGRSAPVLHGGYLQASWFLTGETRPYDGEDGVFARVEPERDWFLGGGPGAIELAVRASFVDLDDAGVTGGKADAYALGINWYLNPNVRLMGNLVRFASWGSAPDRTGTAVQTRFQIAF